jgi:hypothetical protein
LQSRQKKKAENLQVVVDRLAANAYQDWSWKPLTKNEGFYV